MDRETYEKLRDSLVKLGLNFETVGNIVIIRDRSWSRIEKLINKARELSIDVFID
ncbi:MAG: hypothetical protein ACP5NQ_07535 [Vulcanisaeta sp.]